MTRSIPPHRFQDLLDAASEVFIAQGYRRTQMADVARAMNLAKGTVYLYVESKGALFDAVLRHADASALAPLPASLPVPTPDPADTLEFVRKRLSEEAQLPELVAAIGRRRGGGVRAELEVVIRELFDKLHRNRVAIKLIDRCASDYPDLAAIWFEVGRRGAHTLLSEYLASRIERGRVRRFPDTAVAARIVLETVSFWAVHRHWDPSPQSVDEVTARETVVQLLTEALVKE